MAASESPEYLRFFPKPTPYENQREAMDEIQDALDSGTDVLFEGACGTGKTLAALAPALSHARKTNKTVVITTNVHQQMRQFVHEAREIHDGEPIRAVVFKGKGSMCHIDVGYEECQVLRDNTRELVDTEREKRELERRQETLLEEAQGGDEAATDARQSVLSELDAVDSDLDDLQDGNLCERYYENLVDDNDDFYGWLYDGVRTPDEIYEYAHERGRCGYELLKEGIEGVDLAVCNYHHLLDPGIRAQFFRWLGRDPEDVMVVFDEAHNVADAARDHASRALTEQTLDSALTEVDDVSDDRADAAERILSAFRDALVETYEDAFGLGGSGPPRAKSEVGSNWEDVPIANENRRDDLTLAFLQAYTGPGIESDVDDSLALGEYLDDAYDEAYRNGETKTRRECHTLRAATFIEGYVNESGDFGQYPTAAVRRDEGTEEVYGRAELYTCIPREVTTELFDSVHATVLMSATLRPFDVVSDVLGLDDPVTMAYGLQFPEDNRRTFAVDTEPLFASNRGDDAVQQEVTGVLRDAIEYTPGNCLFFFPSYAEAERYHGLLSDTGATRYLDEPGESAEDLRQQFTAGHNGVLCTSLWGTLAEGVSFDGDDARTVAVVGVPYPHLDARAEAVQDAYDTAFGDREPDQSSGQSGGKTGSTGSGRSMRTDEDAGWRYAVEIPTVRKTRQAIGRVLRSPDDFGVRMLIDRRYTKQSRQEMRKYSVNPTFPPEERRELVDIDPEKLRFATLNFYSDQDAYGGNPPKP